MGDQNNSAELAAMQQEIGDLRRQLAEVNEARKAEYRIRLALAVECKTLRDALKDALGELECISLSRYEGLEPTCVPALAMANLTADQILAEYSKTLSTAS